MASECTKDLLEKYGRQIEELKKMIDDINQRLNKAGEQLIRPEIALEDVKAWLKDENSNIRYRKPHVRIFIDQNFEEATIVCQNRIGSMVETSIGGLGKNSLEVLSIESLTEKVNKHINEINCTTFAKITNVATVIFDPMSPRINSVIPNLKNCILMTIDELRREISR